MTGDVCVTGIVLLAAGSSSRLGQPKQLLPWAGSTLVRHAAETALQAALGPVVVVLGAEAERTRTELRGLDVRQVTNAAWRDGMGSSISAGVRILAEELQCDGCIVMTCDQPAVTPDHLRALAAGGSSSSAGIGASAYGGTAGVPAWFSRTHCDALLALKGDRGAKDLILREAKAAFLQPLEGGAGDVDLPGDLDLLHEQ